MMRVLGITVVVASIASCPSEKRRTPAPTIETGSARAGSTLPTTPTGGSAVVPERPWLSIEATDQLVNKDGSPGPALADIQLGGPVPTDAVRARVAELAKANGVDIDVETVDNKVVALRLGVSYGGCCGYEGADKLAFRFARPYMQLMDGEPKIWANDWVHRHDPLIAHVRVRVNRIDVRWERMLTATELMGRTDGLLGSEVASARDALGDRWREIAAGQTYLVELPFWFRGYPDKVKLAERTDLGIIAAVDGGRITELTVALDLSDETERDLKAALRARWGVPRVKKEERAETWSWRTATRRITAELGEGKLTIGMPQPM